MQVKEEHSSVKILLDLLKYEEYSWGGGIGDCNGSLRLQGGFNKFPCYLCFGYIMDTAAHTTTTLDRPQRTQFSVGRNNVNC